MITIRPCQVDPKFKDLESSNYNLDSRCTDQMRLTQLGSTRTRHRLMIAIETFPEDT